MFSTITKIESCPRTSRKFLPILCYANDVKRKRVKYNENDMIRARDRIHQALIRLTAGLQTIDFKLLQSASSVVERTAMDVGDTKAGVERTEGGVERTEKGVERIEIDVRHTKAGVERTEMGVGELRAGLERLHVRENVKEQTLERILERQRILDWICPSKIDYADAQNTLRRTRQIDTGEWLLKSNEFKDWIHADCATFLCSGMPGVGKTILTSFVVSNLLEKYRNDPRTGFAYIYCQFSRRKEQTPEYLLSSILRQLLERHNTMPDEVGSYYRKSVSTGEEHLSVKEISTLLSVVLNIFEKTVLVIDALDELCSTHRNGLVSQVLALQQNLKINVYATSRYTERIAQKASNATQVDILAREEDLRCCLDTNLRLGSLLIDNPDLLELAITKILDVSKGMYVSKIISWDINV